MPSPFRTRVLAMLGADQPDPDTTEATPGTPEAGGARRAKVTKKPAAKGDNVSGPGAPEVKGPTDTPIGGKAATQGDPSSVTVTDESAPGTNPNRPG